MSHIVLSPTGERVHCGSDQTVLEALEGAGYAPPSSCRSGACGSCKARVLDGEYDQGFVLDLALEPEEWDRGYGLMCKATPVSEELTIEFDEPVSRADEDRLSAWPPQPDR